MISIAVAFKALRVLCIALEVADKVIDIVKKSGLIRKTQDVKELGAKVLQAKELGIEEPTDPSKYEEYLKKIDEIEEEKTREERKERQMKSLKKQLDNINKVNLN